MESAAAAILSQVHLQDVSHCKGRKDIQAWMQSKLIHPTLQALVDQQSEADIRLFMRAKEHIEACYETDYTLEMCASDVQCTPHALKRAFRNVINMTYSAYLAQYRLDMDKVLLSETDLRLADIAERLCFRNAQNFVRSFRNQEGITLGEYRKMRK